jgi:hypothetical protein
MQSPYGERGLKTGPAVGRKEETALIVKRKWQSGNEGYQERIDW